MKDVRFTEKKVDQSWKNGVSKNKDDGKEASHKPSEEKQPKTQKSNAQQEEPASNEKLTFLSFINSLGIQALFHMGDIPNPMTKEKETNLAAASEVIDIISLLEEKTKGNLNNEESKLISALVYDLRMRYIEKNK